MPLSLAIIDSGSGNLRSVEKAIVAAGGEPVVTRDPDLVARADRIVVPGQGAFKDCVAALAETGLDQAIGQVVAAGRPYLGICLGLQLLFEESEEHGPIAGLGLLPGRVVRFPPPDSERPDQRLKVPHMGWNQVIVNPVVPADPVMAGIPSGTYFYFVHSYYVLPADPAVTLLTCSYGLEFAAAIRRDNLFACQFHPEKSQRAGLQLLANFLNSA